MWANVLLVLPAVHWTVFPSSLHHLLDTINGLLSHCSAFWSGKLQLAVRIRPDERIMQFILVCQHFSTLASWHINDGNRKPEWPRDTVSPSAGALCHPPPSSASVDIADPKIPRSFGSASGPLSGRGCKCQQKKVCRESLGNKAEGSGDLQPTRGLPTAKGLIRYLPSMGTRAKVKFPLGRFFLGRVRLSTESVHPAGQVP